MLKLDNYFVVEKSKCEDTIPNCIVPEITIKFDYLYDTFKLNWLAYWFSYHSRRRDGEEIDIVCSENFINISKNDLLKYPVLSEKYKTSNENLDSVCEFINNNRNIQGSLIEYYEKEICEKLNSSLGGFSRCERASGLDNTGVVNQPKCLKVLTFLIQKKLGLSNYEVTDIPDIQSFIANY